MTHIFFDDFGNIWRTPVWWPTAPRKFPAVYIEPARGYYARYEGRKSTHIFELEEPMTAEDVELLRREPEAFFQEAA